MIRHIVLFKLRDEVSDENRAELVERISRLPERVPGVREFEVHRDLLGTPQSYDLCLIASFADLDALLGYGSHAERVAAGNVAQEFCEDIIIFDYDTENPAKLT